MSISVYLNLLTTVWQKQDQIALIRKTIIFSIFFLLIACSYSSKKPCPINDSSGKCMPEAKVYEDSLRQENNLTSRKATDFLPIVIEKINNNDSGSYENSLFHRTWVFRRVDHNRIIIGGHYIYWNSQVEPTLSDDIIKNKILQPY